MLTYFPKYFTKRAIGLYFAAVAVVLVAFMSHAMEWYFYLFGAVAVCSFFYFANSLPRQWANLSPKKFEKRLFWVAFAVRAAYVVFSYFLYLGMTGIPFEWGVADAWFYHEMGRVGHSWIAEGKYNLIENIHNYSGADISDSGYAIWLAIIYTLTNDSIFLTRILKAAFSAFTCVLIYRLALRNFGDTTARMAAVFCLLMPNFYYYCGMHLKETEMVFLEVLFVERGDALLREKHFRFWAILGLVAILLYIFMFRTALGIVLVLATSVALVLSSSRVVGWGRRIVILLLGGVLLLTVMGDSIRGEVDEMTSTDVTTMQQGNMQWRSQRENGNTLAKYASRSVFAPLIFTIPFPSVIYTPNQQTMRMAHGGNFVKNIMCFFVFVALISLIFSGKWRQHVFPLAVMLGYLAVIAVSTFAQSERFHMPALPFELMFAAYGVSQLANKHKRWFTVWLVFIFAAIVGWSWFKLKGRGMI